MLCGQYLVDVWLILLWSISVSNPLATLSILNLQDASIQGDAFLQFHIQLFILYGFELQYHCDAHLSSGGISTPPDVKESL